MKNLIIPSKRIKIELYKLLAFFIISNVMNIYSIIKFDTKWIELFSQFHIILLMTLFFYLLSFFGLSIKVLVLYFRKGKIIL